MRILIFVVAYNAEKHIIETLSRIPVPELAHKDFQVLVIDDASTDSTSERVKQFITVQNQLNITLIVNDINKGYGGNQKIGYDYAIKNSFDVVALLHGDGQYAPEYLPAMLSPVIDGNADVVFGSRMIDKKKAIKGGMPVYKWVGNQVLTFTQNMILGTSLSEFHTGYRVYKTDAIRKIPIESNSNYFDFDTEIIIQMIDTKARVKEISIPTFYGDEISYVNGFKYAWLIVKATLVSRFVKRGWMTDPRFRYD